MYLTVEYYDRGKRKKVSIRVPADVLTVSIPALDDQGEQPALDVTVNTDAILVHRQTGERVSMHEFTELLADADSER